MLAKALHVHIDNNMLHLPPHIGSGYVRFASLANGLQLLVNETVTIQPVQFIRLPSAEQSFTLRFDEVLHVSGLTIQVDKNVHKENNDVFSGIALTNALSNFSYTAPAGIQDRCVNIYFTAEWLQQHFGIQADDELLRQYLSIKTPVFNFELLNFHYRELMEDIFFIKDGEPLQKAIQQNRVMLLMEMFFKTLYNRQQTKNHKTLPEETIRMMMQIESILVKDLSVPPPTIPELAKTAMMSETKLKNTFKQVYSYSIYEYYQKSRMLKARQLLRARRFSIKEIGLLLGFRNLSNFSIAYRKEFNMLPSDV